MVRLLYSYFSFSVSVSFCGLLVYLCYDEYFFSLSLSLTRKNNAYVFLQCSSSSKWEEKIIRSCWIWSVFGFSEICLGSSDHECVHNHPVNENKLKAEITGLSEKRRQGYTELLMFGVCWYISFYSGERKHTATGQKWPLFIFISSVSCTCVMCMRALVTST